MAEEVELWTGPLDEFRKEYIGDTLVLINGEHIVCRMQECNMGDEFSIVNC